MKHTRIFLLAFVVLALLLAALGGTITAQSSSQWGVEYFPNLNWSGPAVTVVWVPSIFFNWGTGAPASNMPVDNWTMRAASDQFFYDGVYRFEVLADDEFQLFIDGIQYLNTIGAGRSGKPVTLDLPMRQGNHHVELRFREFTGNAYIFFRFTYIKGTQPTPPPPATPGACATPQPSASSVQTQFGDYTPCIQQGLHQSKCFVSDGQWNSPNLGSIEMEPMIAVWGNCTPDTMSNMVLQSCTDPRPVKCSKTGAGWFPS